MSYYCNRCNSRQAIAHERFCRHCRDVLLAKWENEGYLEPKPEEREEQTDVLVTYWHGDFYEDTRENLGW